MAHTSTMAKLIGYTDFKELQTDDSLKIILETTPANLHALWRAAEVYKWISTIFPRSAPECDFVFHLIALNAPTPMLSGSGKSVAVALVRMLGDIQSNNYRPMDRREDVPIRIFKTVLEECDFPERVKTLLGQIFVANTLGYQWLLMVANIELLRADPFVFTTPAELDEAHIGWSAADAQNPLKAASSEGHVTSLLDRLKIRTDPSDTK